MKKLNKGIALLLSLVMALSVMCVSAFAEGEETPSAEATEQTGDSGSGESTEPESTSDSALTQTVTYWTYSADSSTGLYSVSQLVEGTSSYTSEEAAIAAYQAEAAAHIGTAYYDTLANAVKAVEDNQTITLVKNIDLTDTITLASSKTYMLDMNGMSITSAKKTALQVEGGGTVTVTGNGTVTVKNSTVNNFALSIEGKNTTVNIESGTFSTQDDKGYGVGLVTGNNSANQVYPVVNISGGTIRGVRVKAGTLNFSDGMIIRSGAYCVSVEDSVNVNAKVNISGGTITGGTTTSGTGRSVRFYSNGTLSISGGTISGGNCGVWTGCNSGENPRGVVSISGSANISGTKYGVQNDFGDVRISGGIVTGDIASVYFNGSSRSKETDKVSISGGNMTGELMINENFSALAPSVTGGTFSSDPSNVTIGEEKVSYVADGYWVGTLSDGRYVVGEKTAVKRLEPTYSAPGHIAYWTIGDKFFSDEGCTAEIAQADTVIAQLFAPYVPSTPTTQPEETVDIGEDEVPLAALPEDLAETVTVTIGDEEVPLSAAPVTFSDVASSGWEHDAVAYVEATGIMKGVGGDSFDPNGTATGDMLTTMLYRMDGGKDDAAAENWADAGNAWASENAITDGINYSGGENATREQLVTMIYRMAQKNGYDVSARGDMSAFTDADSLSDFAAEAMSWAISVGLIKGMGDGTVNPTGELTRAQIATIFMRLNEMMK